MSRQVVDERASSSASPEAVWELLTDATTWSDWGAWSSSELVREGTPPPGGVHSIKKMKLFPTTTVEETTVFEPPRRLGYELRSGLPLRGYRGEVTLTATGGGTEIRWHAEFEPKIPGTGGFYGTVLRRFIADTAKRLGAAAEKS